MHLNHRIQIHERVTHEEMLLLDMKHIVDTTQIDYYVPKVVEQ